MMAFVKEILEFDPENIETMIKRIMEEEFSYPEFMEAVKEADQWHQVWFNTSQMHPTLHLLMMMTTTVEEKVVSSSKGLLGEA